MVVRMSWPGAPTSMMCSPAGPGVFGSTLTSFRPTRQNRVVLLLQAVLADATGIHEAEQLGSERRVRRAPCLRIDAHRRRFEGDRGQVAVRLRVGDLLCSVRIHVGCEDHVVAVTVHGLTKSGLRSGIEAQVVDQLVGVSLAIGIGQSVEVGDDAVFVDRLGENDGAGSVVDGPSLGRDRLQRGQRVLCRQSRQLLVLVDLPVGEARGHAGWRAAPARPGAKAGGLGNPSGRALGGFLSGPG